MGYSKCFEGGKVVASDTCLEPWNVLRIQAGGNCYFCTPAFSKVKYSLGNILTDDFDDIWNGETARRVREDVYKNIYSYCKTNLCCKVMYKDNKNVLNVPDDDDIYVAKPPKQIYFAFDYTCSQSCVFCRDSIIKFPKEENELYFNAINKKIMPYINQCCEIEMNGIGEFIDSPYIGSFIKKAVEVNPQIKFSLISNGLNFTKENIEKLGLENRITDIKISLHSATQNTYKKIFRQDNFQKVIKNLEYISSLKAENKIKAFSLMFVICSLNYKEIPEFCDFAAKYGAIPAFSCLNNTSTVYTLKMPDSYPFDCNSIYYNDFVKIMQDKRIDKYRHLLSSELTNLKKNTFFKSSQNLILYYLRKHKIKI